MFSRLPRLWLIALTALLLTGCGTTENHTPPAGVVSQAQTSRAGRIVQLGKPGRISAWGEGQSMAPLYGDNTYVVVEPIAFEALTEGMIVAYRNRKGHNVVHRLVRPERGGWIVEGINNPAADRDRVTPRNLLGVVYATFYAQPE